MMCKLDALCAMQKKYAIYFSDVLYKKAVLVGTLKRCFIKRPTFKYLQQTETRSRTKFKAELRKKRTKTIIKV